MTSTPILARLYRVLEPRRTLLFIATLGLFLLLGAGMLRMRVSENIMAMLPDQAESLFADFELLHRAPFLHKALVTVSAKDDTAASGLTTAARNLAEALATSQAHDLFTRVEYGPPAEAGPGTLTAILANQPNYATPESLRALETKLAPEAVRESLRADWALMNGPEGWAMKDLVRLDPLNFRATALKGIAAANLLPGIRLRDGVFVSGDGRHALLVAETPIDITDSSGSERLLRAFETIAANVLPEGITANVVSGHLYAQANATAIKADMRLIMIVSCVALLAIFLLFLRSLQAGWVLLIPLGALCAGGVAVSLAFSDVSGITLGFGGVLLGISVDYGLHAFIALKQGGEGQATLLARVARPVLLGAATTMAAFGVLLLSDLPAQRQLAVFSIAGLAMALLLSLVVLPHLISPSPLKRFPLPDFTRLAQGRRPLIVALGLCLLALAGWQGRAIHFDGNLRALGLTSKAIDAAEIQVRETWGDVRGKAMVLVQGDSLEQALEANDRLYAGLRDGLPSGEVVSLAALLPSESTQAASRERWNAFWEDRAPALLKVLHEEGRALGFSKQAFEPFRNLITQDVAPLSAEGLHALGLERMYEGLLLPPQDTGKPWGVLTLAPDTAEAARLTAEASQDQARFVSQSRFGRDLGQALRDDFVRFLLLACLSVSLILLLALRSPRRVLLAMTPVFAGVAGLLTVMGLGGMSFNLYNMAAAILVIGLGVDYGVFMLERLERRTDLGTEHAVLLSGLTTLAGFGSLALASHPALNSIGLTVLVGMAGTLPGALLLLPALARSQHD
ncbi:putative exporter [Desulfocurvibacter africanus PCS]|uniref:Putative exporter n=1 Tax=Desulfocurvibacter africanus PCS TaxID=1262666 RepID=M5PVD4_DESAF|nr:MMPL family transporter [Desulfocurvibacter africanus]EMG38307.1 putative exporter [Desulfocurvibacter africanus PCS]